MSEENSQYADSAQARQLDRNMKRQVTPAAPYPGHHPRATPEARAEYQRRQAEARAGEAERSHATVKRGLAELEAFFGGKS